MSFEESLLDSIIETIRPVKYSGAKIDDEFKSMNNILKDPDPEKWDQREKVLKKIAGMAMQHEVNTEEFASKLRQFHTTIQAQIEDLRSAIVRTAAAMCVVLNDELNVAFASVFEYLVHSFIKQLAVKAIPTRESSHECISRVIKANQNGKILKQIIGYVGDKDKVIRTRVSGYVLIACESWDEGAIQKNLKDILRYLNVAQADGESLVRKNARQAILALAASNPTAIAQFYHATEDVKVKKELGKILPESVQSILSTTALTLPSANNTARRSFDAQAKSLILNNKPSRASVSGEKLDSRIYGKRAPLSVTNRTSSSSVSSRSPSTSSRHGPLSTHSEGPQITPHTFGRAQTDTNPRNVIRAVKQIEMERSVDHNQFTIHEHEPKFDREPSNRSSFNAMERSATDQPYQPSTLSSRNNTARIRQYVPPTITARDLTPEQKQNKARQLANTLDLIGGLQAELEIDGDDMTKSQDNFEPVDSRDLLAKLQALRNQVQKLNEYGQ